MRLLCADPIRALHCWCRRIASIDYFSGGVMRYMLRKKMKSGVGSELIITVTMLVGIVMIYAMVVASSVSSAIIRTQMLSDIVVDGASFYAKDKMNIFDEAYYKMAEKIFACNQSVNTKSALGFNMSYGMSGVTLEDVGDNLGVISSRLSSTYITFFEKRAKNISGSVLTTIFKLQPPREITDTKTGKTTYQFEPNQWPVPTKSRFDTNPIVRNAKGTPFNGPLFKDQIASVSVSASANIPFAGDIRLNASSTVVSIAKIMYNSRLIDGRLDIANTLERIIYQNLLSGENENNVKRGSPQFFILQNAKQYIGDGYANVQTGNFNSKIGGFYKWRGAVDDVTPVPYGNSGHNHYGQCYLFVNSCLRDWGGFSGAMSKFNATTIERPLKYEWNGTDGPDYAWYCSHPAETFQLAKSGVSPCKNWIGTWYAVWNPDGIRVENGLKGRYEDASGNQTSQYPKDFAGWVKINGVQQYSGKRKYYWKPASSVVQSNGVFRKLNSFTKMYVSKNTAPFSIDRLKAGDILVFSDPNKLSRIYKLWDLIQNTSSIEGIRSSAELRAGPYAAHYALYLGNGMVIESGGGEPPDGSVVIGGLRTEQFEGTSGGGDADTRHFWYAIRLSDKPIESFGSSISIEQAVSDFSHSQQSEE